MFLPYMFRLDLARIVFSLNARNVPHAFVFKIHVVTFSANQKRVVHPLTSQATTCSCGSNGLRTTLGFGPRKILYQLSCSPQFPFGRT